MRNSKIYLKARGLRAIVRRGASKLGQLSPITIIFVVLEIMSLGGILLQMSAPPRSYSFYYLSPLGSNETRRMSYYINQNHEEWGDTIPIATGQYAMVNVTSINLSSIKVIHVEAWERRPDFSSKAIYESNNKTHHFVTINPSPRYRIIYLFIRNLTPHDSPFDGCVTIYGVNQDYFVIPVLLLFLYFLFSVCSITTKKLKMKLTPNLTRNSDKVPPSFFHRIKFIWILLRQEFDPVHIIILTALVWVVIQPLAPVPLYHSRPPQPLYREISNMERELISGFSLSLFLLAVLLSIETGEFVAGKKRRGDIGVILTFPISRIEWIMGYGVGILVVYSGVFGITLMLKAVLLSMRIRLVYPVASVVAWFLLILLTLAAWIFTGMITSFRSHDKYSSAIKGMGIIACVSLLMFIFSEGIMKIERLSYELWPRRILDWTLPDAQFHGIFITTLPRLHNLFPTFGLTGIWLVISLILVIFLAQRYEVT